MPEMREETRRVLDAANALNAALHAAHDAGVRVDLTVQSAYDWPADGDPKCVTLMVSEPWQVTTAPAAEPEGD